MGRWNRPLFILRFAALPRVGYRPFVALVERKEIGEVTGYRVGRWTRAINTTVWFFRLADVWIDCGPPNQKNIVQGLFRRDSPRELLLTHHHEDHGGNAALLLDLGMRVRAPAESLSPLSSGFPVQFYRRVVWGRPRPLQAEAMPLRIELDTDFLLEPIPAPGHSADMTCLLEPNRGWLFAGDLFVASQPRYLRSDENVGDQIRSIRQVLQRDFDVLFCGHRGVVAEARAQLVRKVEYLVELTGQSKRLQAAGVSIEESTRRLLGKEGFLSRVSGFDFSKQNLIRSCLDVE